MKQFNAQSFFSRFPDMDLGKIRLRDIQLRDADRYFEMMSNEDVNRYSSEEDIPNTVNDALSDVRFYGSLFYRKLSVYWAIAEPTTNELIGTVGFNNWNFVNRRVEVSYDLMSKYWRQGIMTMALTNILKFAFSKMYVDRIEARTMLENKASRGILNKFGFVEEGIARHYRVIRGEPADIRMFSLLRKDFPGFLFN